MKDEPLIERLRRQSPYLNGSSAELLMNEATDEIMRLQAQIDTLRELREFDRKEIERLRASKKAWKMIAKQNGQWNAMLETALQKALDDAIANTGEKNGI